tara:strand:- start:1865 stop:2362 length:498 start_codon:yes stop_codon:yes gene_type:complete
MLDKKFFTSLASKMRKSYVNHIFIKGKDVYGREFKGYSTNKTKWASIMARKSERAKIPKEGLSYGEAKRMGILKRQDTGYKNTTSPILSGDLMNDAKPSSTMSSAKIRFTSHGGKINNLAKMGRVLTDDKQPLPKSVINMIDREVGKEIKLKLPKSKRFKFKLGK